MTDQNFSFRLSNTRKHCIKVYLEPWGEVYELESKKQLRVDAVGPLGLAPNNMLGIESSEDGITVWGWAEARECLDSLSLSIRREREYTRSPNAI